MFSSLRTCLVAVLCVAAAVTVKAAPPKMADIGAMNYLVKFGYLRQGKYNMTNKRVVDAIADLQAFMGMPQTGKMDAATHRLMLMPRCGMRDKYEDLMQPESYTLGITPRQRWPEKQLTYRINKYSESLTPRPAEKAISDALKLWADVTDLTFTAKKSGQVNINIRFERGAHGDGKVNNFDGPGGTLAHAAHPMSGDTHFDDAERWSEKGVGGTSLLSVGAHEFGHALGLGHSNVPGSMMYPTYDQSNIIHSLHRDDIAGIQALYGPKKRGPKREPTPSTPSNNLCNDASIDAALSTGTGTSYVFKGDKYYRLANNMIAADYPKSISSGWPGLPSNLDAAFYNPGTNHTYFFKGAQFWRYSGQSLNPTYPRRISVGFPGIPNDVDLAFRWSGNNKIYFFKGSNYWRYIINEKMPDSYPKPVSNWRGLPNNMNAAMQHLFAGRMESFFFKGGQYYRYNDRTNQVDESVIPFPRSSGRFWFGCR